MVGHGGMVESDAASRVQAAERTRSSSTVRSSQVVPGHAPVPGLARPAAQGPQWNSRVERRNDTPRLAFRALHVGELAVAAPLAEHQRRHNKEGPLAALDMRSPCEHLVRPRLESTPSSA